MAPTSKQLTPAGWEAGAEAEDQLFPSALDRFEASVFQGCGPVSAQSPRGGVKQEVGTMSAGNSEDLPSWEQKETMIQMLTHGFDNVRGYEYSQCAPLKSTLRPAPSSAAVAAISASVRSAQWTRFRACAVGAALMPCEHVLRKLPYTAALCLRTVAAKSWRRARTHRLIRNVCYTLLLPIDSLSVQGDKCASVNPGDAAKMSGRIRMASLKA